MSIIIQQMNFLTLYLPNFSSSYYTTNQNQRFIISIIYNINYIISIINYIFSNTLIKNTISDNLTATISDHLTQLIILPNIFLNPPSNKSNICERVWSNFVQENVILDYFSVDWNSLINNDKDLNLSFNNFLRESMLFQITMHPLEKSQKRKDLDLNHG